MSKVSQKCYGSGFVTRSPWRMPETERRDPFVGKLDWCHCESSKFGSFLEAPLATLQSLFTRCVKDSAKGPCCSIAVTRTQPFLAGRDKVSFCSYALCLLLQRERQRGKALIPSLDVAGFHIAHRQIALGEIGPSKVGFGDQSKKLERPKRILWPDQEAHHGLRRDQFCGWLTTHVSHSWF